MKANSI